MSSDAEIAWAAGLFEGEGCFSTESDSSRPRASMSSTDLDVLQRFQRVVGCGNIYYIPPRRPQHKPAWQWMTPGDQFFHVYDMLLPWLGERRAAKGAEVAKARLDFMAAATSPRQCECCGKTYVPEFKRSAGKRRYCSTACSNKTRRDRAKFNRAVFQPQRIKLPDDDAPPHDVPPGRLYGETGEGW